MLLNCQKDHSLANWFFLALTSFADGLWVMMVVTVVFVFRPRDLAVFLLALIIGNIFLQSGKYFLDLDRPLKVLGTAKVCVLGLPVTVRSFPSGHSFSAFLLFMFLKPQKFNWITLALLITCTLAAFSRIYVGAHFPRDVAAGALIGISAYLLAKRFMSSFADRAISLWWRLWGALTLGFGSSLIYIFLYPEKTPELEFILTPAAGLISIFWLCYGIFLISRRKQFGKESSRA